MHPLYWQQLGSYRAAAARREISAWEWQRLTETGSLTAILKAECSDGFSVRVLKQSIQLPNHEEARRLNMRSGERAVIRDVQLLNGDTPWVFAHTVMPLTTLQRRFKYLSHMGSKPLGEALFSDPKISRGEIEIAKLNDIWGRRSLFHIGQHGLLVAEFFLPAWAEKT